MYLLLTAVVLYTKQLVLVVVIVLNVPFLFHFQGILFAKPECLKHPDDLIRLWLHESSRVYGDKLVEAKDSSLFHKKLVDTAHKYFEVRL